MSSCLSSIPVILCLQYSGHYLYPAFRSPFVSSIPVILSIQHSGHPLSPAFRSSCLSSIPVILCLQHSGHPLSPAFRSSSVSSIPVILSIQHSGHPVYPAFRSFCYLAFRSLSLSSIPVILSIQHSCHPLYPAFRSSCLSSISVTLSIQHSGHPLCPAFLSSSLSSIPVKLSIQHFGQTLCSAFQPHSLSNTPVTLSNGVYFIYVVTPPYVSSPIHPVLEICRSAQASARGIDRRRRNRSCDATSGGAGAVDPPRQAAWGASKDSATTAERGEVRSKGERLIVHLESTSDTPGRFLSAEKDAWVMPVVETGQCQHDGKHTADGVRETITHAGIFKGSECSAISCDPHCHSLKVDDVCASRATQIPEPTATSDSGEYAKHTEGGKTRDNSITETCFADGKDENVHGRQTDVSGDGRRYLKHEEMRFPEHQFEQY